MEQTAFEQMGQQIDDTAHRASRAASAITDALEDTVIAARSAAKHGTDAAAELLNDTKRSFQRHPIETAAVTFAVGIAAAAAFSWLLRRKQL